MRTALATELRYRERVMGTTWDARRSMRVRYVEPVAVKRSAVMHLDAYRNL